MKHVLSPSLLMMSILICSSVDAQNQYRLSLSDTETQCGGSSIVEVISQNPEPLQGFNLSVRWDATYLGSDGPLQISELLASLNPEFFQGELFTDGSTLGVVMSSTGASEVPAGDQVQLAQLTLNAHPTLDSHEVTTPIQFDSTLALSVENNVLVNGAVIGTAEGLLLEDGVVTITCSDLDADGISNECDVDHSPGNDCDENGILDLCDTAEGANDCNFNGIPDSCELDCNQDGIADICQGGGFPCEAYAFSEFKRADMNLDSNLNLVDPIILMQFLFLDGESLDCEEAGDVNDDGTINVADVVFLLQFIFTGGLIPPEPFVECGVDPTSDDLTCFKYENCSNLPPLPGAPVLDPHPDSTSLDTISISGTSTGVAVRVIGVASGLNDSPPIFPVINGRFEAFDLELNPDFENHLFFFSVDQFGRFGDDTDIFILQAEPLPPTISGAPSSTSSTHVVIAGNSAGELVRIIGPFSDEIVPVVDSAFVSEETLLLNNGVNTLSFSTIDEYGTESAQVSITVDQDSEAPELVIESPQSGDILSQSETVILAKVKDLLSSLEELSVTVDGIPITDLVATTGGYGNFSVPIGPLNASEAVSVNIVATDLVGNSISQEIHLTYVVPAGPTLELVSGSGQSGEVLSELTEPITVRVLRSDGTPFADKFVTFEVTESDGQLLETSGGDGELQRIVLTDANGEAQLIWKLGSSAGPASQQLKMSSEGVTNDLVVFTEAFAAPAASIAVHAGDMQATAIDQALRQPLVVVVTDDCGNPVNDVEVIFESLFGIPQLIIDGEAVFDVSVTTDILGHAEIDAQGAKEAGISRIEARIVGGTSSGAQFTIRTLEGFPEELASFKGLVLSNANEALEGALVTLTFPNGETYVTTSMANGEFLIENIESSGQARLDVDGAFTTGVEGQSNLVSSFPCLEFQVEVISGVENEIGMPAFLPALNPLNSRVFDGLNDLILAMEEVPGVEFTILAGTEIHDENGNPVEIGALLALNPVNAEKIPMPLPDGSGTPFAWTLQPSGYHFNPPVKVQIPNFALRPPGAKVPMVTFNHSTHQFEVFANGRVSEDGVFITSDPGEGIAISGWGAPAPPPPPPGIIENCPGLTWYGALKAAGNFVADLVKIFSVLDEVAAKFVIINNLKDNVASLLTTYQQDNPTNGNGPVVYSAQFISNAVAIIGEMKACFVEIANIMSTVVPEPQQFVARATQIIQVIDRAIANIPSECCTGLCGQIQALSGWFSSIAQSIGNLVENISLKKVATTLACIAIDSVKASLGLYLNEPPTNLVGLPDVESLFTDLESAVEDSQVHDVAIQDISEFVSSDLSVNQKNLDSTLSAFNEEWQQQAGGEISSAGRSMVANAVGGFSLQVPGNGSWQRVVSRKVIGDVVFTGESAPFRAMPGERVIIQAIPFEPTTVAGEIDSLSVDLNPAEFAIGSKSQFTVTAYLQDGSSVDATNLLNLDLFTPSPTIAINQSEGTLTALKEGGFYLSATIKGVTSGTLGRCVTPGPLQTAVIGFVATSIGTPVVGANVTVLPSGDVISTDATGRFELAAVAADAGPISIVVDSGGNISVSDTYEATVGGITDLGVITVTAGNQLFLTPDSGSVGTTIHSNVLLDTETELLGWALGICHDSAVLNPQNLSPGLDTMTLNGGSLPEFYEAQITPEGIWQGAVIDYSILQSLPPGSAYSLLSIEYLLVATPGTTELCFCNSVGSPPIQTVLVDTQGSTIPVAQNCATITVNP